MAVTTSTRAVQGDSAQARTSQAKCVRARRVFHAVAERLHLQRVIARFCRMAKSENEQQPERVEISKREAVDLLRELGRPVVTDLATGKIKVASSWNGALGFNDELVALLQIPLACSLIQTDDSTLLARGQGTLASLSGVHSYSSELLGSLPRWGLFVQGKFSATYCIFYDAERKVLARASMGEGQSGRRFSWDSLSTCLKNALKGVEAARAKGVEFSVCVGTEDGFELLDARSGKIKFTA